MAMKKYNTHHLISLDMCNSPTLSMNPLYNNR